MVLQEKTNEILFSTGNLNIKCWFYWSGFIFICIWTVEYIKNL